jgi:hypothetical protein
MNHSYESYCQRYIGDATRILGLGMVGYFAALQRYKTIRANATYIIRSHHCLVAFYDRRVSAMGTIL